jgi:tetratricopeptide (TPR) repeat protein
MAWLIRIAYVALLVLLKAFVDGQHPPWYWTLAFLCAIVAVDSLTETNPTVTAWIYTAKRDVTLIASGTSVLLGLILLVARHPSGGIGPNSYPELVSFGLQGVLVGVLLRVVLTAYFAQLLRDSTILAQRLMLMVAVTILVMLLPTGTTHRHWTGLFLIGVGLGFYLHYLVRGKEHARAMRFRLLQNISSSLELSTEQLRPSEVGAVKAFAALRWSDFDRILETAEQSGVVTTVLKCLEASKYRLEGDYDRALNILTHELGRSLRSREFDALLHLQMALNYGDNADAAAMESSLKESEAANPDCLLTQVTIALREAESIQSAEAAADSTRVRSQNELLRRLWKAMDLYERQSSHRLLALVTGSTVPMTWTFLQDAYGYILLKSGRPRFAKSLFVQSIHEDPTFASAYLHLGEWYLNDAHRRPSSKRPSDGRSVERSLHLARTCFHIAKAFQKTRNSLIRRRAQALLDSA